MDIMIRGGPFMWPILIESILALWVIVERGIFFLTSLPRMRAALMSIVGSVGNPGGNESLNYPMELGDFAKAIDRARREGAVSRTLLTLEADSLAGTVERHLFLLSLVAWSGPLLGLLGTTIGFVDVFMRMQALGGQMSLSDLAGGIRQALLATAAGLAVAIPALFAHIGFGRIADRFSRQARSAATQIAYRLSMEGLRVV